MVASTLQAPTRGWFDVLDDWLKREVVSEGQAASRKTGVLDLPSYDLGVIKGSLSRREIYKDL